MILWLAQQQQFEPLAQYGLAGVVIVVLLRFAQTTITGMRKELDEERAYSREQSRRIETEIVPAALRLAEVAERLARQQERDR